mmetsp:Transcript_41278/g.106794  ORF Transcript_41278/g.106794 Transcript_41278/m.106794 type:complete len:452 (-) Transcript_41278:420-1775(-)
MEEEKAGEVGEVGEVGEERQDSSSSSLLAPPSLSSVRVGAPFWCSTLDRWDQGGHPRLDFFRHAKWSPDGSCVLASTDSKKVEVFEPFAQVQNGEGGRRGPTFSTHTADVVHDVEWYKGGGEALIGSYLTCVRGHPVKLHNGYTGSTTASFVARNHLDETDDPYSCVSSTEIGSAFAVGYDRCLRQFHADRSSSEATAMVKTRVKRRDPDGQRGAISCLAVVPGRQGMIAAGAYDGTVGLYHFDQPSRGCAALDLFFPADAPMSAALMDMRVTPDGVYLIGGHRSHDYMYVWDLRMTAAGPVTSLCRSSSGQLKVGFDLDWSGRCIVTGMESGGLKAFDVYAMREVEVVDEGGPVSISPTHVVDFNPASACIAVAVGDWKEREEEECPSSPLHSSAGQLDADSDSEGGEREGRGVKSKLVLRSIALAYAEESASMAGEERERGVEEKQGSN